jgi:hypothetical protein
VRSPVLEAFFRANGLRLSADDMESIIPHAPATATWTATTFARRLSP